MSYAELDARSNFSFLEGGSHPQELVGTAQELGLTAIGIADRNSLAGVVRAYSALKELEKAAKEKGEALALRLLVGCRLAFTDGHELIVYPRDRAAYGRLCRLLSIGKSGIDADAAEPGQEASIAKNECRLSFEQAVALGAGLIALVPAPAMIDRAFEVRLAAWRSAWPDALHLAASPLYRGDDRARLAKLAAIARRTGAPLVATNAVLYHHPDRRILQDVLTCIRDGVTIDQAGFRLQAHAERYLKSPSQMAALFRGYEGALARTAEIADACHFRLSDLKYQYPDEPVPPGKTPQQHLQDLTFAGARQLFKKQELTQVLPTIRKELRLIRKVGYATYFLTVHDIVAWARRVPDPPILCQGRGSAANSVVCFCLGITSVNPTEQDVLFERFISEQRSEPPDIDVDFEHERREEVMQYVYQRYGRHRAAICATIIHYRPRSAIRDVGKALGLTEDVTAALANTVWGSWGARVEDDHVDATGLKREDARLKQALDLTAELINFPRHLSQHVGGFVLTQGPLVETVPVANAAMANRTFIEWDKDDIDALNIMKVDVLALGMLTAIRRGFELIERHYGETLDLATLPRREKPVYDMLCKADSLGVFQVESRAQMNMLPRLQPREFYDLVVQVAIVRPGPIQGKMVHPYLKNRAEKRAAEAAGRPFRIAFPAPSSDKGPADELEKVLRKTMGVPLFQEQAMRIAMVAAEFTGDEANGLRRAMATFRHMGTIHTYEEKMVGRMVKRGYSPEFAERCFNQIKGFGEYGFPESHAAAFAHLVYVSAWIKCFYPDVFAACLLNSQPMGFYAPAQIIRDARAHGVTVHPPDLNHSDWDSTLEPGEPRRAVRLGLRQIDGFRQDWADKIMAARAAEGPFRSLESARLRTRLPAAAFDMLAASDALGSLALARRPALWAAKGLPRAAPAPLFTAMGLEEADGAPPATLPVPPLSEEVVQDYETIRLSLKAHPMSFLRTHFGRLGVIPNDRINDQIEGKRVAVAGVVLVRQRPGSAKGVVFLTIEDETGIANIVVWPDVFKAYRGLVMGAKLILVKGRVQRAPDATEPVIHIVAETVEDRTADLALLSDRLAGDRPREEAGRRHPRDIRVLPRSRDFH